MIYNYEDVMLAQLLIDCALLNIEKGEFSCAIEYIEMARKKLDEGAFSEALEYLNEAEKQLHLAKEITDEHRKVAELGE